MTRRPRIHFPGAAYHVILRGNDGQAVFFDEEDRSRFYSLLQAGTQRFGHRIHAFCLMTNHLHLAVQVQEAPLARIMQNLGFRTSAPRGCRLPPRYAPRKLLPRQQVTNGKPTH